MKRQDMVWLALIATSLGAGVLGGSYLKKDQLLPICHALAPNLFPPIVVNLPTGNGQFDSRALSNQAWQVSFVGPKCAQACQAHLDLAEAGPLPHLVVRWSSDTAIDSPWVASGPHLEAASSVGLSVDTWQQAGYVATWRLNEQHHIEQRWVNQSQTQAWD